MRRLPLRLLGATIIVPFACVAWVAAQQEPQRPVFTARVDLLRVDVQVVANDGQPIPNLELGDF